MQMSSFGSINKDFLVSGKHYVPIYHMDIEVFPEWWSIVFRHKGKEYVFTSDNPDLDAIKKITDKSIITAYNAKGYDLKILYAILQGLPVNKIYELSMAIVANNGNSDDVGIRRFLKSTYWSKFKFIDLIDDMTGSLKEHESNMGMEIIESSVPWGKKNLTNEEIRKLLHYNKHDVKAQVRFFKRRIKGYLLPKIILAELFNIDPVQALKDTNANLAAKVLKAKKLPDEMLKDRPYRLPKHIEEYVKKYVPEEIIETFLTTGMDEINKKNIKIDDFENKGKLGKGGIHTIMRRFMRVTNKKHRLILIDVRSYYPNLMIWFDFVSRAVRNPEVVAKIYGNRVDAKLAKNKALDKALKLVLNTIFGATGQKWNSLFDPNQAWSVTITGQLLLYALSKDLWLNANCKIVQANTDGILVAVKDEDYDKVVELVTEWEDMTNLEMDYEEVEVFAQRDVNNYACKFTDGNTKVKGALCMQALTCDETAFEVVTWNNWDMRITHEAVFRYLIYKEPIEETITNCTDLKMFTSTTKVGSTYLQVYQKITGVDTKVQKVNRVLAVKSSKLGLIYKFQLRRGRNPGKNSIWLKWKNEYDKLFDRYEISYDGDKESYLKEVNEANSDIYEIMSSNDLLDSVEDEAIKVKLLNHVQLKAYNEKVGKISENSYIMNDEINSYDWNIWKNRIDYDFYINVVKDKVEGWLK